MRGLTLLILLGMAAPAAIFAEEPSKDPLIAKGRYLTVIAGCGDCHTPGYVMTGKVDENVWLTGDTLGFRGGWGTTYPVNLRLRLAEMDEDTWVNYARTMQARPPMPWFNVAAMTDEDLRAIYRYVRHLGPAGQKAPDYLPPDKQPDGPVVVFPAGPG